MPSDRPWYTTAAELLADPRAHWADTFEGDMVRYLLAEALKERAELQARITYLENLVLTTQGEVCAAEARIATLEAEHVDRLHMQLAVQQAEARVRELESCVGWVSAYDEGAAAERAAIVAWLREQPKLGEFPTWRGTADMIEAGLHAAHHAGATGEGDDE